jgi:hypothetical protein
LLGFNVRAAEIGQLTLGAPQACGAAAVGALFFTLSLL